MISSAHDPTPDSATRCQLMTTSLESVTDREIHRGVVQGPSHTQGMTSLGIRMDTPLKDGVHQPAWSPYDVWRTQILEPRKQRRAHARDDHADAGESVSTRPPVAMRTPMPLTRPLSQ
jgi:hypothetical protein